MKKLRLIKAKIFMLTLAKPVGNNILGVTLILGKSIV